MSFLYDKIIEKKSKKNILLLIHKKSKSFKFFKKIFTKFSNYLITPNNLQNKHIF